MENEEKKKNRRWLLVLLPLLLLAAAGILLITQPWKKNLPPAESTAETTSPAQTEEPSTEQPTEPAVQERPEDDLRRRLKAEGEDTIELTEAIGLTGEPVEVNGKKTLTGSGSLVNEGLTGDYIIVIMKDGSLTIDGPDVDGTDAAPNGILVSEGAKLDLKKGELKSIRRLGIKVLGEANVSGKILKCGGSWMDIEEGAKAVLDGAELDTSGSTGINTAKDTELKITSSTLMNATGYMLYNSGTAEIEDSELSGSQLFTLANGGTMTVKGSKISDGKTQGLITNYPDAELTVEDSEFSTCSDYLVYNAGKAVFSGSELSASGGYTVYNAGGKADITLKDTTVSDSKASSLYNRKDCTMQLENVTVKTTGGHALINRAGTVTAKGFYVPDRVKSFTVRNDSATDTDMSYGSVEIEDFEFAGSDNFCVINYNGTTNLKNGTIGVSSSSGIYIREGESTIEQVKVLGVDKEPLAGIQIGKDGLMTAVVTMTDVDVTGAPRGITNYGTLTFNSGKIHDNKNRDTLEAAGGVNNFGTFVMKGGTISGNVATNYGGGVLNQGKMEFIGGTIENNTAGGSGGGIIVSSKGKLTMSGGIIRNNTAGKNGGGIYNGGVVVMSAGTITGNRNQNGGYGGGVSNDNSFTMYYGNIISNVSSSSGGGLFNSSNGTMLLTGGNVTNNRTGDEKSGGGIFNTGKLTLQGTVNISNNTAAGSGGGVSNGVASNGKRGSVTISGGTISGNKAEKSGGGIANLADMTISGGTVKSNTAKNYGGGLYASEDARTTISGGTITTNKSETQMGGGVANRGYLTMTGGTITANVSGGAAGGFGNFSTGTAILSGGSISSNKSTNGKGGGGIYNVGTLTLKNQIVVYNNTADGAGGGINNNVATGGAKGSLTIAGGTISSNKAATSGGAVCNVGTMTMSGGTLADNTAVNNGGAVYCDEAAVTTVSGGTISGNKCGKSGGAILTNGKLTISGGTIRNNEAEASGGAVSASATAALTISGGTFRENKSGNNGGGVYCAGTLKMTGGTVDKNTSANYGGGIFCSATSTSSITGGTISANKNGNELSGGGIFNSGKMTVGGSVEIVKNTAAGSGGGISNAISSDGTRGQLTVTGGTFRENECGKSGAAILNLADMTLTGGSFSGNKATNNGGVLYSEAGATASIKGAEMKDNEAGKSGGAMFLADDTLISGCTISGNKAADKGGAIYVKTPAEVVVENTKIDKNVSTDLGSAIMVYQGKLTLKDSDAFAGDDKKAVYSSDADFTLDGTVNAALCTSKPIILSAGFKADSKVSIDTKGIFSDGQVVLTGDADAIKASYDKAFTIVDLPNTLVLIEDGTLSNPNAGSEAVLYDTDGTTRLASGSLAAMINRAADGQVIELIADAEIISKTPINVDVTIRDDGTERTITISSADRGLNVNVGHTLTVTGSAGGGLVFKGGGEMTAQGIFVASDKNQNLGGTLNVSGKVTFRDFNSANTESGNSIGGSAIIIYTLGKATLDGTAFVNNTAAKAGGAVYCYGTLTLKNVSFEGNKAAGGGGGAVYNNGGTLTVDTATFTNNSASANGGAIQLYGGTIVLKDVTASDNTAGGNGADAYLVDGAGGAAGKATVNGGSWTSSGTGMKSSLYLTCSGERKLDGKLTATVFEKKTQALSLESGFSTESRVTLYLEGYANGQTVLTGDAAVVEAAVNGNVFTVPELPANLVLDPDGTLKAGSNTPVEAILIKANGTEGGRGMLTDMLTAAQTGETVKLIADAAITTKQTVSADITITDDGKAHTVTISASDRGIQVVAGKTLTITGTANGGLTFKGGSLTGSGIFLESGSGVGAVLNVSGKVTFSGFSSENSIANNRYGGSVLVLTGSARATLDGTTVTGNSSKGSKGGGAILNNGGKLTLTNVSFSGNSCTTGVGKDVYSPVNGSNIPTLTVSGGTAEGLYSERNLTLGGKPSAVIRTLEAVTLADDFASDSAVTLYLSAYTEGQTVLNGTASVIEAAVAGNAFTLPDLPDTLVLASDGKLQAKPSTAVEAILYSTSGEKKDEGTLAAMLAAAGAGETVEVVADAAVSSAVTLAENITLRDDGTARTVTVPANGIKVPAGKALTLKGNAGLIVSCSGSGAAVDNAGTLTLSGKLTAKIHSSEALALEADFSASSQITLYLDAYEDGQVVLTGSTDVIAASVAAFTLPDLPNGWTLEADGKLKAPAVIPPEAILYESDGTTEKVRGTFAEACAGISADGQILEIKANVTIPSTLTVATNLTIRDDGTARTVTVSATDVGIEVAGSKTLTITGSSGGGLTFAGGSLTGAAINVNGRLDVTGKVIFRGFSSSNTAENNKLGGSVINNSGTVTLSGTLLENNSITSATNGGAICNSGTMTLSGVTVSGSSAKKAGGAVYNTGTLTISNSEFKNNKSTESAGGAIYNKLGTLTVSASTFTGNTSSTFGGVMQIEGANVTLTDVAASSNSAGQWGKDVYVAGSQTTTLIISGGSYASGKGSNTQANSCAIVVANKAGTSVTLKGIVTTDLHVRGTLFCTLAGDFSLQSDIKLHLDSYALNRKVLGGTASVIEAAVEKPAVTMPGLPDTLKLGTDGTLQSNVYEPNPDSEAIVYNSDGTYAGNDGIFADMVTAASDGQIIELKKNITIASMIDISKNLTIRDDGTARTVSVTSANRGMTLASGKTLTIIGNGGLTFAGGNLTGAGIHVAGTLNVSGKVTFSGFVSSNGYTNNANGSAVYIAGSGIVNMNGTTFEGNSSQTKAGGAIYNGGKLTMTNVTFTGNSAGTNGGAIFNYRGTMTLTDVTFTANNAGTYGGAMQLDGGVVTLNNVTSSGSTTGNYGRDVYVAKSAACTLTIDGGSYTSGEGTTSTSKPCAIFVAEDNTGNSITLNHKVTADIHLNSTLAAALGNDFSTESQILIALPAAQFKVGRVVLTGNADVIAAAVNAGVFSTTNTAYVIDSEGKLAAAP